MPYLKRNKPIRFLAQQISKAHSFKFKANFGGTKGENPVSLGLSIQTYAYLFAAGEINEAKAQDLIKALIERLKNRIQKGFMERAGATILIGRRAMQRFPHISQPW